VTAYHGPIVDVDVHNLPVTDTDIRQYLPSRWQEFKSYNPPPMISIGGIGYSTPAPHVRRSDGGPPGSSYQILKEELLDAFRYHKAVLTHNIGQYPDLTNQYFMVDVCRAANTWMVETWLPLDDRLAAVIVVPTSMIEEAVAEVHRWADHPQIVGILFASNPLRRPFGDPIYHPIYAAAVEHGLAITTHVGIDHTATSPGGPPGTVMANASVYAAMGSHHISSFLTHGVFEKFPDAKFVLKEYGIGWLPGLVWRLEAVYDQLRIESPWVKRRPWEYIHDHVRLSTQPLETGARTRDLGDYLSVIDGIDDVLLFSSDYPHPSMDDHMYVARELPAAWHRKVFCDNACATYGWTPPPFDGAPQAARSSA
jgi:predicted TIM-barrel fold metal-dependent hydrolase